MLGLSPARIKVIGAIGEKSKTVISIPDTTGMAMTPITKVLRELYQNGYVRFSPPQNLQKKSPTGSAFLTKKGLDLFRAMPVREAEPKPVPKRTRTVSQILRGE